MALDVQSCERDHKKDVCCFPVLLQGKEELGEACLSA